MRIVRLCVGTLILATLGSSAALAENATNPLCTLVQREERLHLEAYELESGRADTRLAAEEQIFTLVDALWKDGLIERITHLKAKHDRDVARIDVDRRQLLLKRQQAVIEIYENYCSTSVDGKTRAARLEKANKDFAQADCHRIGKDLAIAEADLAFDTEWLTSVVDLRENGVATAQDVIYAERDVEIAAAEARYHAPRVQACIDSGAAASAGD
jgi:hypothetical protein